MNASTAGAVDNPATRLERPRVPTTRPGQRRLIVDAVLLGVAGAIAAQLFTLLLHGVDAIMLRGLAGYQAPGLPNEGGTLVEHIGSHGLWLVPVATTLGGVIVGLLIAYLAPEAEGHGTDTVVQAFHQQDGGIRARVGPLKLLASAITIGSGGSAGREGPIALVTAAAGSWYATVTGRSARERRLLLLIGMSAGLSAIFRSPIGCAIMAIEVLYSDMEFEASALLYTMLSAIVAYALNGFVAGWDPLFRVPANVGHLESRVHYGWFVVLGIAAGVIGTIFPVTFYWVRDQFRRLPGPLWIRPAIGGLLTGILALVIPQILGGGYGWVQEAIDGRLVGGIFLVLMTAKVIATSFTVASGGSGGVFAPSLYVGGMLGGICATVAHEHAAPFVIVGMAAAFAGAAHVPIASLMMVTEMTGGYSLLVPAALVVLLSYLVQTRLSERLRYRSLYEHQVASRADSPAHHAQQLTTALRLLRERSPRALAGIPSGGALDLVSLLRTGVPIELPDGYRLMLGVLRPDSECVGRNTRSLNGTLGASDTEIVAIVRGEHLIAPTAPTALAAGDRLVLIAPVGATDALRRHLDPA
jgi:CIC family chloride channel protein